MKLKRVRLDGFGQFNQGLDVSFDPDRINLVVGRNEAGKSTLLNAISGILFGFRDLNLVRRYEPWAEHEAYGGEIDLLTEDGREIRIARDFRASTAEVQEVRDGGDRTLFSGSADPRGTTFDDARYFECIHGLIGIQDESVFRNTVFVGQMSLRTEVSDQIRRLLSGSGGVDYKGALHDLHSRYSELTSENPWRVKSRGRKRALDASREELANAEKKLEACRSQIVQHAELESELIDLDRRGESHQTAIAALERMVESLATMLGLLEKRDEAERRATEARRRHESFRNHQQKIHALEDRIRREFSQFRNAPADFTDLVASWISEHAEKGREEASLEAERSRFATLEPTPNRVLGGVLGGSLLTAPVLAGLLTPLGIVPGIIAGGVLGVLGVTLGRNLGTGYRAQREELERKIAELESAIRGRENRIAEIAAATGQLLVGSDPAATLAGYRQFSALVEERKRMLAAMRALGEADAIARGHADAERELGRLEACILDVRSRAEWIAPEADRARLGLDLGRLRGDLAAREASRDHDRERAARIRVDLAALVARMDVDLAGIEESVIEKRREVVDLELEKDALKEAIDALDACIKDFQESDVFRLADEMSQIFARITGDKYTRVHLGPSLEPLVATDDRVGIRPEELSQGAHDQLYFAMRVAMVRHLSRNVRLPIFLDDPFVNFDAERLSVTRDVLRTLPGHQVIMVTCDRNYENWTDAVIDLDRARVE